MCVCVCYNTVEQQLQFHATTDSGIEELQWLNKSEESFETLMENFVGNFDEPCLIISADGEIKINVSTKKKRQRKFWMIQGNQLQLYAQDWPRQSSRLSLPRKGKDIG